MADNALDMGTIAGKVTLENMVSEVVTQITTDLAKIGEGVGDKIKSGIEDPFQTAKNVASEFLDTLGPVGVGIAAIGTAAGAVGFGLFEMASHAAEAGEQVLNFARITGDSVADVSQLAVAASIGGSSLDSLQGMLFQMERRMDAAGAAGAKFNNALGDLNINADQFRASDPSERIATLSEAMHNAQGNTNLMADAIAVMGRGAISSMPLLMKNFDDLQAQSAEVAYTWTTTDTDAAERFNESTGYLSETIKGMANEIGATLLPAMTLLVNGTARTVQAFQHILDLGGLVSGTWHLITGAAGESALASQSYGAMQDNVNGLWKAAMADGTSAADAMMNVGKQMVELGYSTENVVEQTGLSTAQVKALETEMKVAEKAGLAYAAALDRVNDATDGGHDISNVDDALKGWVKDMIDGKVKMEDMVEVTGLSTGQLSELEKQIKADDAAAKGFATSWQNLSTVGTNYAETISGIEPKLAALVTGYIKMGASVSDLTKAFPELSQAQVKALDDAVKGEQALQAVELQTQAIVNKTHGDDINDWVALEQKKHDQSVALLQDQGKLTSEMLAAENQQLAATVDAEIAKHEQAIQYSKGWYQKQAQDAKASLDLMLANTGDFTAGQIRAAQQEYNEKERLLNHWAADANDHLNGVGDQTKQTAATVTLLDHAWVTDGDIASATLNKTTIMVRLLDGEVVSLDDALKRQQQGNSITYDLTTTAGVENYRSLNSGMQINLSDEQIMAFAQKGGTLQQLIQEGYITMKPYKDGGPTGDGGPSMLHANEFVVPEHGALVLRSDSGGAAGGGINVYVSGMWDSRSVGELKDAINNSTLRAGGIRL